jgi:NADH-quinone oxidoreductase subunit K
MPPLWMYLVVAAALFSIGTFGVLARRNGIAVLMSVELMLNAVNVNLVAFWRFTAPMEVNGFAFAAFVFVIAAAEAAVGSGHHHLDLPHSALGGSRRSRCTARVGERTYGLGLFERS